MTSRTLFLAVAVLAVCAACATIPEPRPGSRFELRPAMQQRLNPSVLSIWEVTNNAVDDDGQLDPAQIDAAEWQQVVSGAETLAAMAHEMATAETIIAAASNNSAVRPGELSMAEVQRLLDSDRGGYRQLSGDLATLADKIAAAARARDARKTDRLAAQLNDTCASCHARFWHPR